MTSGTMSHRERVRMALSHQEPDRIPVDLGATVVTGLTVEAHRRLAEYLGMGTRDPALLSVMFQVVQPDERVMRHFDVDFRQIPYGRPLMSRSKALPGGHFIDDWGITLHRPEAGLYYDIVRSPLEDATIEDLEDYDWPDPLDPGLFDGVEERAHYLYTRTDYALVGPGMSASFFELSWMLRGLERFLMDLVVNPALVLALFRQVVDIRKAMMGRYLDLVGRYLDVVYVADDLAIQTGPLVSMDMYRALIKPYQREYYNYIKERTEAKLFYHCCGSITPLLEDFIELGVDIVNPVQVSAEGMDSQMLKREYGDRICFWGGIDTQRVLPYGSPDEVRDEVRRRISHLAPKGGYVLAPVHNIQPDVPAENVCAAYQEALTAGRYR